jgi:uncharacterized membrane protein
MMDLLVIVIASVLMVPLALFTAGPVRIILGIFFVLVFPGYTLLAALFPKKNNLDSLMRLALTLGLSLAMVIILLLILNFTPWGIRLDSSLIALAIFTCVMAGLAWLQRRRLSREERFFNGINLNFKRYLQAFRQQKTNDKVLNILLVVAVIGVLGTVAYVLVRNKNGEKFTQFYVLNLQGVADNYPHDIINGQSGTVLLDIINEENAAVTYKVEILIDGVLVNEIDSIVLKQGEQWEQPVTFTPSKTGDNQEVQFELFKNDSPSFQELHLWIDVL